MFRNIIWDFDGTNCTCILHPTTARLAGIPDHTEEATARNCVGGRTPVWCTQMRTGNNDLQ